MVILNDHLFSTGILSAFHSCGLHLQFIEMNKSEKRSDVLKLVCDISSNLQKNFKYCIYDNGCHLAETYKIHGVEFRQLDGMKFYIDRFHIKNHTRRVCQDHNMSNNKDLVDINSQVAEQNFSIMKKFRHSLKHMSKNHFNFFLICFYDKLNDKTINHLE